jgi:hypothetical protein
MLVALGTGTTQTKGTGGHMSNWNAQSQLQTHLGTQVQTQKTSQATGQLRYTNHRCARHTGSRGLGTDVGQTPRRALTSTHSLQHLNSPGQLSQDRDPPVASCPGDPCFLLPPWHIRSHCQPGGRKAGASRQAPGRWCSWGQKLAAPICPPGTLTPQRLLPRPANLEGSTPWHRLVLGF